MSCGTKRTGFNDPFSDAYHQPSNNHVGLKVGITLAILTALGIGAIVAAYFHSPQVHHFIDKAFTEIRTDLVTMHMKTWEALTIISLPTAGAVLTTALFIYIYRRHKNSKEGKYLLRDHPLSETLANMAPTKRQIVTAIAIMGALILLGGAAYSAFRWVPVVHQWTSQHVLPVVDRVLQHPQALWQALAYFGFGSVVATALPLMTGWLIDRTVSRYQANKKIIEDYNGTRAGDAEDNVIFYNKHGQRSDQEWSHRPPEPRTPDGCCS